MGYFKRIFNNCKEVSEALVTEQPKSFKHRLEIVLHVRFCKCCKNFKIQSKKIEQALKHMSSSSSSLKGAANMASDSFKKKAKEGLK